MRRSALSEVNTRVDDTHPGLWLDKYIKTTAKEDIAAKAELVKQVVGIKISKDYKNFFQRYREALRGLGAQTCTGKTTGRMAVGLGGESVLETHLCLHHTYGAPYIPGSAIKGLLSRFAATRLEGQAWQRNLEPRSFQRGEAQTALFGSTEQAGLVLFFDALPQEYRIHPDIMTPHHTDYYGGELVPPADWDSPIPVHFLSVTGEFLFALGLAPGVDPKEGKPWLEAAWQVLAMALSQEGIGAKTTSGYGRICLDNPQAAGVAQPATSSPVTQASPVQALLAQFEALKDRELSPQAPALVEKLYTLEVSPEEKRQGAQVIWQRLEAEGLLKGKGEKRWYQLLRQMLGTG